MTQHWEAIAGADAPMWELLWRNVPGRREHIALIDPKREISYGALAEEVNHLAGLLKSQGVVAGDRVLVHLRKSIEEVVAMFAAWRLGAVAVNVNQQWTLDQFCYVANDCRAKAAVVAQGPAKALLARGLPEHLSSVIVQGQREAFDGAGQFVAWSEVDGRYSGLEPTLVAADDLCAIIYTSGSTGRPKGVMLTHRNIRIGALSVTQYLGLSADDRLLSLLPYSFDAGLNQLTTMFLVGGTIVHQPTIMAAEIVSTAARHAVTGIAGVPPLWSLIVRYLQDAPTALPTLKRITNTGGKISPDILDAIPQVFPGKQVFLMYGLTESFRSTFLAPEKFMAKKGSIGQAVPHAQVFAIKAGVGIAGPGEQGELVHVGPLISLGYWERPEDTAARIRPCPELAHLIGEQQVVWSGDIVEVDADGDLWFVGRNDDMIKSMGFRISPTEVEDLVAATGLTHACVAYGQEDAERGQVVHIVCLMKPDSAPQHLLPALRQSMPSYMVPAAVFHWTSTMPLTASGKLDRPAIIAACRNGDVPHLN